MKTFKDRNGREWRLDINVTTIKRVRDLVDVDLLQSLGGELMVKLADDEIKMVDVLYGLCKPQADELPCAKCDGSRKYKREGEGQTEVPCPACEQTGRFTDAQFGEALVGEAIDDAYKALLEELAGFFRDPAKRRVMETLMKKQGRFSEKQLAMLEKKMADPRLDALLERKLQEAGDSFTNALESFDSTPAPSSSAS